MTSVKVTPDKKNAVSVNDLLHEPAVSPTSGLTDAPITFESFGADRCLVTYEKYKIVNTEDVRQFMGGLL